MYTVKEVFNQAIAILDEMSDTGTIVDSQIKEYKYRAPYLLDLWQHEIGDSLQSIEEYKNEDADDNNKWILCSLPIDLKRIREIMFVDSDSNISSIPYKKFGVEDIYLYFPDLGTARMLYVPIPVKITALTQTLAVNDSIATSGAYYLAEQFALADQNAELAQRCREKFNKLQKQIPQPFNAAGIIDVYGISAIK
jgi:hypothetical protein